MYTLYSALSSNSLDYGINYIKVFYDTLMLGVKCKDDGVNHSYYGHVIFDKINYNYTDYPLQSNKSIILNLGLLKSDLIQFTGNGIIDVFFDQSKKQVTLFVLSALDSSFMPKIYKYDINNHDISLVYPTNKDKLEWSNSTLGTLTACHPPLLSISEKKADIVVTTVTDTERILNILTFDITSNPELINYTKYGVGLDSLESIKKIQRVDNELQFYSCNTQNITPFKIVDK